MHSNYSDDGGVEATPQSPGAVRRMATLLDACGLELQELTLMALEIQAGLGPILSGATADRTAPMVVQSLDLMTQRLDGLQGFLSGLALSVRPDWSLTCDHLTADMKLTDQVRRLQGAPNERSSHHAGAIEIF